MGPTVLAGKRVQVNLDKTDSMGPGKLVRHMQNLSYTYDEYLICIGLVPSISSVICKNPSYSGPSYPSSPVYQSGSICWSLIVTHNPCHSVRSVDYGSMIICLRLYEGLVLSAHVSSQPQMSVIQITEWYMYSMSSFGFFLSWTYNHINKLSSKTCLKCHLPCVTQ